MLVRAGGSPPLAFKLHDPGGVYKFQDQGCERSHPNALTFRLLQTIRIFLRYILIFLVVSP